MPVSCVFVRNSHDTFLENKVVIHQTLELDETTDAIWGKSLLHSSNYKYFVIAIQISDLGYHSLY